MVASPKRRPVAPATSAAATPFVKDPRSAAHLRIVPPSPSSLATSKLPPVSPASSAAAATPLSASDPAVDPPAPGTFWRRWHDRLLPLVLDYEHHVTAVQHALGVDPVTRRATRPVVDAVLRLASELGNEVFLALWAAINACFFNPFVATRVIVLWASCIYFGQYIKDSLRLPRPGLRPGSQVARLETHYAAEFGFPSTHAMSSITQPIIVLGIFATEYVVHDWGYFLVVALALLFWLFATPVSRLYLGVHSSLDIAGGLLLGLALLLFVAPMHHVCGHALLTPLGATLFVAAVLVGIVAYPRPRDRWTNSPGDTVIVIATTAGMITGLTLARALHPHTLGLGPDPRTHAAQVLHFSLPVAPVDALMVVARLVLTVVLFYGLRIALKPLTFRAVHALLPPVPPEHVTVDANSSPANTAPVAHSKSPMHSDDPATPSAPISAAPVKYARFFRDVRTRGGTPHEIARFYVFELADKAVAYFCMALMAINCTPFLLDRLGVVYRLPHFA